MWNQKGLVKRKGRKSPDAQLLSWTKEPFNLIYQLFHHDKHGTSLDISSTRKATDEEFEFVFQLLKENWCGLLEMPNFVWQFVLPRSLHAQIRAHRHWSFFSESHQLSIPSDFVDDGDYFKIPEGKFRSIERAAMKNAQDAYRILLANDCLPSLARGVLPMHINLQLTGGCSLRSLFQTIILRHCHILQSTYWNPLLQIMKEELCLKVDRRFERFFELKPCDVNNRCLSDIEQKLRIDKKDPHMPCSIYLKRFVK